MTQAGPGRRKRWPWLPRYLGMAAIPLGMAWGFANKRYDPSSVFVAFAPFVLIYGGVIVLLLWPCPRCGAIWPFSRYRMTCWRCGQEHLAKVEALPERRRAETPIR
jgi:hypothetical protein